MILGHTRNGKEGDSGSFESLLGQEGNILDKIRHIQRLNNTKMFFNCAYTDLLSIDITSPELKN